MDSAGANASRAPRFGSPASKGGLPALLAATQCIIVLESWLTPQLKPYASWNCKPLLVQSDTSPPRLAV